MMMSREYELVCVFISFSIFANQGKRWAVQNNASDKKKLQVDETKQQK